jgi:histidyl-tRNA synthetase
MRDIVPPDAELRRLVTYRILDVYASYGYEVIETPALEDIGVLVGSDGGENEKLIFKVLRRGAKLNEQLQRAAAGEGSELADMGLRFDLTVPLARFVANHLNELPMPFKVAHVGPVWRAERPQRGRWREFTQCDIDIVGEQSVAAEIELCTATLEALEKLGITGCTVRLNDRRLLRALLERFLGPPGHSDAAYIALDKLDKLSAEEVTQELVKAGYERGPVQELLAELARLHAEGLPGTGTTAGAFAAPELVPVVANLHATLEALGPQETGATYDPALVRGMGYYTGQIFEVGHPDVPYSLAGGGRYDGMTERFGAPALPMCGFSIGFERVCDLVRPGALSSGRRKQFVTCESDDELLACLCEARARREREPDLVLSVVRRARNVRKQREDFQRLGYTETRLFQ